jgi:LPS sulfotransferase NodH
LTAANRTAGTYPACSYLICSMPRSGGGLLAGLLRSTGVAGRPEEYFWKADIPIWRERWGLDPEDDYFSATLREGMTPNGVFGARVMWSYIDDVVAAASALSGARGPAHAVLGASFPDLRYVLLSRRDRVAQAVSWALAVQTGVWYAGDERDPTEPASYDRPLIGDLLRSIEAGEQDWASYFREASFQPLSVAYEEIAASPERATRSVLNYLGIEASSASIEVRTQRQAGSINVGWIERYRSESGPKPQNT